MVQNQYYGGFLQASVLGIPWSGRRNSSVMILLALLLNLFAVGGVMGTCSTADDCYPGISSELVDCLEVNNRNMCNCNDCFERSPVTELCVLRDGCWKIEVNRCIDRNDQQQHFPLIIALYTTSVLSIVLLLLVTILMKCATHKPETRDFLNSRRKMDSSVAVLFVTAMISTFVFIGSVAGSLALLFTTDFEVEDFFGRCIGGI